MKVLNVVCFLFPSAPLDEHTLYHIALGMAEAVRHLHKNCVLHKDIALRNFVLSQSDEKDTIGDVIVIDMGLARFVSQVCLLLERS